MAKRKLSSSYVRKKEDIKTAVTRRAVEKIRIAADGPGYRTGGQVKTGTTNMVGSPAGTRVKTLKSGQQIIVAARKAINPNGTKINPQTRMKSKRVGVTIRRKTK